MPTGYRVELSPNNRATCKNKECKDAAVKITKGDLRFGSLFTVQEHTSWAYKHWGCVTPEQIKNVQSFIDGDMDLLDGYDELPQEWQDKIDRALKQGHVDDEDWRGDVELNRSGEKGFRLSAAKKKKLAKENGDGAENGNKPVKKRGRKPAEKKEAADEDAEEEEAPPKKRGRKSIKKEDVESDEAKEQAPAKKKIGKKVAKKNGLGKAEHTDEEEALPTSPKPKNPVPKKSTATKKEPAKGTRTSSRAKTTMSYTEPKEDEGFLLSAQPKAAKKDKPVLQKKGKKKGAAAATEE